MSESIEVVASFGKAGLRPTMFKRGEKLYRVQKVNLQHATKHGASRLLIFNIEAEGGNPWVLVFNTEDLKWRLVSEYNY